MVIGHQKLINHLDKSSANSRLAHAYLFSGSKSVGKKTVALEFIKRLIGVDPSQGIQPDILLIEPEITEKEGIKKETAITISQIKKVQHQMSLSPYQLSYKIALIEQAEKMTAEASNCLLKTLEEPNGQAIIILISSRPQQVLPTILSRCQILKFLPVPYQEIKKALQKLEIGKKTDLEKIIRLANGRPGIALEYLKNPDLLEDREKIIAQLKNLLSSDLNIRYQYVEEISKDVSKAQKLLSQWVFWFRDLLLAKLNCGGIVINQIEPNYQSFYSAKKIKEIIVQIEKTHHILGNPSFNSRLALEVLMLEF